MDSLYIINPILKLEPDSLGLLVNVNTLNNEDILFKYIPLIIALIAVFVGPILQYKMFKKQIKTQLDISNKQFLSNREQINSNVKIEDKKLKIDLLYKNKHKWIDELKKISTDYISILHKLIDSKNITVKDLNQYILYMNKLLLHLDMNIDIHKNMHIKIIEFKGLSEKHLDKPEKDLFINHSAEILSLTQQIIEYEYKEMMKII